MSAPADFDVRALTYEDYRALRILAAIEDIYAGDPRRPALPPGRISCREAVRRYEDFRLGKS